MTDNSISAEIVICGGGIAGVSAAYFLSVKQGYKNVWLIEENAPLSLTSDHSTECYRNWWPDGEMVALMNRSIDLLEELADESNNYFHLNRRGYLYCTGDETQNHSLLESAKTISKLGAGEIRIHYGGPDDPEYKPSDSVGYAKSLGGADLLLNPDLIQHHYPGINKKVTAALHVRRAGWLSAQQLGMYLLSKARANGLRVLQKRLTNVEHKGGKIQAAILQDGTKIYTPKLVIATGPFLKKSMQWFGLELPVYNELHQKVAIKDSLGIVDRNAPLLIWNDSQFLDWRLEERQALSEDPNYHYLLGELPAGVHTRPEGGPGSSVILILWEYRTQVMEPTFPVPIDPLYPEIVLRGLSQMLPGLRTYIERVPQPRLDGGFYTRTPENRPLIGKLPIQGTYILGALSGFGIMSACAAGELLAACISGKDLPAYASAFALSRYEDPGYLERLKTWGVSGQL